MASGTTKQELLITTRMKDLVSKEFKKIGKAGKLSAASIAAGFVAAKVAIGGMKVMIRGTVNVLKSLTTEVADQGDEFAKMSKKLGVGVETLSAFKHIAELSGTSFETLGKGFKALAKNAVDFKDGVGEAKDAFDELGIVVSDPSGDMRDLESIFIDTADALGKMEDTTKRAAHAQRIFGRAGLDLIPVFLEGKQGIIALREEAERLGIVWTEEAAAAAEVFNDSMLRMQRSIGGVKLAIGTELMPVITAMFDDITEYAVENRDEIVAWSKAFIDDAIPAVIAFGREAIPAFKAVLAVAGPLAKAITTIADGWEMFSGVGKAGYSPGTILDYTTFRTASTSPLAPEILPTIGGRSGETSLAGLPSTTGRLRQIPPPGQRPSSGPSAEPYGPAERLPLVFEMIDAKVSELTPKLGEFDRAVVDVDNSLSDLSTDGVATATNAFGTFFNSMLQGTANTASAFKGMVSSILADLARMQTNKLITQIIGAIAGGVAGGGGATQLDTSGWVPAGGGTDTVSTGSFNQYADGGFVGGSAGAPQLAVVHGGEYVMSRDELRSGGGGAVTINMTVNPSPGMDERALADHAAAAVSRSMRESRGFRRQVQGTARGGLW